MPDALGPPSPLPLSPSPGPGPLLPANGLNEAWELWGERQVSVPVTGSKGTPKWWESSWSTWLYRELRRAEYVAKSATTSATMEISPTATSRRSRRDTQAA